MLDLLSERDRLLVASLQQYRLLSTTQLRRLHFTGHSGKDQGYRATIRVLARLEQLRVVSRLDQRIGGYGGGSAAITWQLTRGGQTLATLLTGQPARSPIPNTSWLFAKHTVAVAEVALGLVEAQRDGHIELLRLETEPDCWQTFLGPSGVVQHLKPDLYVTTATSDYEDHWFIEIDMGTENRQTLARKAGVYDRYRASGRHEAVHGVFPRILWATPDARRRTLVAAAVAATEPPCDPPGLHTVATFDDLPDALLPPDPATQGSSP